jgi:hypothetical protein
LFLNHENKVFPVKFVRFSFPALFFRRFHSKSISLIKSLLGKRLKLISECKLKLFLFFSISVPVVPAVPREDAEEVRGGDRDLEAQPQDVGRSPG